MGLLEMLPILPQILPGCRSLVCVCLQLALHAEHLLLKLQLSGVSQWLLCEALVPLDVA